MKNKKIITIILMILGIILIAFGIFLSISSNNEKKTDDETGSKTEEKEEEEEKYTKEYVENYANSMFGDSSRNVEVEEQENRYVIYVKDSNSDELIGRYYFDKDTGMLNDADIMDQEQTS